MFDDKRFIFGMAIGCLLASLVMFSIWLFDIVPHEQMIEFNKNPQNPMVLIICFFALIFASGFVSTKIFKRKVD